MYHLSKRKIYGLHIEHIMGLLSDISLKYKDKKNFLDIGCGDGTKTIVFNGYERNIHGLDYRNWLSGTVKNKISFKQGDFLKNKLPYEDSYFDLIFSFDVIEHLPDYRIMLKEIKRVIKKDGVIIISTPNRYRLLGFPLVLFGLRKFPYYPDKSSAAYDSYSAHLTEYSVFSFKRLMKNNGFKIIKVHRLFYGFTGKFGLRSFFSLPFSHNIILECILQ
jgi:SAM-dependent methyltransferase